MNTILAITALVIALGLVAAFTIAIPILDGGNNGHIALADKGGVPNEHASDKARGHEHL
jgi:hypothetical protein